MIAPAATSRSTNSLQHVIECRVCGLHFTLDRKNRGDLHGIDALVKSSFILSS